MRQVSLDELFTWREGFGLKAKEAFGGHYCDVSPQTYADLKLKCDVEETKTNMFFDPLALWPPRNGISIHIRDGVPEGVVVACGCKGGDHA